MNLMAKITIFSSLVVSFIALSCSLVILSKDVSKKPDAAPALKKEVEVLQTKSEEDAKKIQALEKKSETLNNTLKELKIIGEDAAKQPVAPPAPPAQPVTPPADQTQQPAQPPVTPPATEVKANVDNAKKITIQVAALNMRETPSTNGDVKTVLKKNQKVTLVGDKKEANGHTWIKVKTEDGTEGWIADSFAN